MLPLNNIPKGKVNNSAKKEFNKISFIEEKQVSFLPQNFSPQSEQIVITVIPCGREDGKNSEDEMPYEMKIRKKVNEHSLKEIFTRKHSFWEKIFKQHLDQEAIPNFSIYRKPFEYEQDPSKSDLCKAIKIIFLVLHILYMKSSEKALTRNYNAQELELFCHNRFYGPLVVAYNLNKQPYYLCNFSLNDLTNIESINRNFQNKSIKDDYVPECLLEFQALRQNLESIYKEEMMEAFTFYMFKYKSSWCPNKKDSHDSKSCIYAHHTRDFRRPPEIFKYLPEDCETLVKGLGWDKCEKGLKCNKCHTTVERLYHPDKYKRIFCDVIPIYLYEYQRTRCNKSEICAFYHSQKEKQQANRECKNYRRSVDQNHIPDVSLLQENLNEYYKKQLVQLQSASISKTNLNEEAKESSIRDSSSSSAKSQIYDDFKIASLESHDIHHVQSSPSHMQETSSQVYINGTNKNTSSASNFDKSSPLFQPSYRSQQQQPLQLGNQHQQNYYMNGTIQQKPPQMSINQSVNYVQLQSSMIHPQQQMQQYPQSQISNMKQIQLIQQNNTVNYANQVNNQTYPDDNTNFFRQKEQLKMKMNYFDYSEQEDHKTRNSTFSKASDGRDEIKKSVVSFQAFIQDQNPISFMNPVDQDQSPVNLNRQPSGKSPQNFASPITLDFLNEDDDDFFLMEEARTKSKTEFVKRERQVSEDSNQDDFQLPGDAQDYLNSILPNNSIKFKKHSYYIFQTMGGKKKQAKKGDADDKYDPAQMTIILQAQVQSLKERLVLEQERKDKSKSTEENIRQRERELCDGLEEQQKKTKLVVSEMTDQYKRMEKDLQEKINKLRTKVDGQEDNVSTLKQDLHKLNNDKEEMITQKDDEIKELKKRIDEMSSDFAEMLKDTLTKMQERIEFANKQWEDDNDANMLKKFEEMAAGR